MSDIGLGRYKMGTLCRMTGLKPELLRAWQRRYGLLEPERTEGGHRLYTADDLRLALHLRDLVGAGRSIGELARRGRATLLAEAGGDEAEQTEPEEATPIVPTTSHEPVDIEALRREVVQGAVRIDATRLRDALDRATASMSREEFVAQVVKPCSQEIGDLWASGGCSVAGEHLASAMIRQRLTDALRRASPPEGAAAQEAIVACAPDDFHENGALVVAARLAAQGWRVVWLGAATPIADLDQSCRLRRPHAVYVSCTLPGAYQGAREPLLAFARRWQGAFELSLGGQGVPEQDAQLTDAGVRLVPVR